MNREQKVAMIAVMLPCLVFLNAFIQVYGAHVEHEATFTVFEVDVWPKPTTGPPISQILTWGDGKYQFIGNYSSLFELDHTYHVVYVQKAGFNNHVYNNLIILDWNEVE